MTKVRGTGSLNWVRLYAAATLAGAGLGILVILGALPGTPQQLTSWIQSVDAEVAILVVVLGCAVMGFALTAVAHLGVRWQLRRQSRFDPE